jgi:predicted CoA-binding protein
MDWTRNLVETPEALRTLLAATKRIAVLGIKSDDHRGQPAWYVPAYLADAGFDVIPVPVYYPHVQEILGRKVYRQLVDIPGPVDLVNVFRRPGDVPAHVDDILAKRPAAVWLQQGIRHDAVAERLAREGIKVVQDRCLMVEHRHLGQ